MSKTLAARLGGSECRPASVRSAEPGEAGGWDFLELLDGRVGETADADRW